MAQENNKQPAPLDNTGDNIIEGKTVEKHAGGRPTAYPGDAAAVKVFDMYYKQCEQDEELPTKAGLAIFFDVCKATIDNWCHAHPEFLGAFELLKARQEKALVNSGLNGKYNSTICKLMMCSNHGYTDKQDFTTQGEKLTPQIVSFADVVAPKEQVKETPNGDNTNSTIQ